VDQPRGYSDDFGAPRYGGGYHLHAGNDIFAPRGTPIRAPFAGTASNASNSLGGLSVYVTGALGYVYNAHLSSIGTLGSVSAGTIVGYVGDSGDAQGGATHDHFEWHPNAIPSNPHVSPYGQSVIGGAIDPYPYLNSVC
jgi:murein DD-endopeptidase MepM/ murein hydrolase activator NlpD